MILKIQFKNVYKLDIILGDIASNLDGVALAIRRLLFTVSRDHIWLGLSPNFKSRIQWELVRI